MTCDILDPATMQSYVRDPRGIAKRAEIYLNSLGIADQAFFGPEPEFLSSIQSVLLMIWVMLFSKLLPKRLPEHRR